MTRRCRWIILRNLDGDIAEDDGLAAEAGIVSDAFGHADEIEFVLVGCAQVCCAVFNDDVAGGATAVAAAIVIEGEIEVHREIENRTGLAVAAVRDAADFELVNGTIVEKCELGHKKMDGGQRGT